MITEIFVFTFYPSLWKYNSFFKVWYVDGPVVHPHSGPYIFALRSAKCRPLRAYNNEGCKACINSTHSYTGQSRSSYKIYPTEFDENRLCIYYDSERVVRGGLGFHGKIAATIPFQPLVECRHRNNKRLRIVITPRIVLVTHLIGYFFPLCKRVYAYDRNKDYDTSVVNRLIKPPYIM